MAAASIEFRIINLLHFVKNKLNIGTKTTFIFESVKFKKICIFSLGGKSFIFIIARVAMQIQNQSLSLKCDRSFI